MSDLDELKLRYTEENPDEPLDDMETIAFHSTPHKPKPAPKVVKPRRPQAEPPEPPRRAVPLTMGLSRGVPTPNGASAAPRYSTGTAASCPHSPFPRGR